MKYIILFLSLFLISSTTTQRKVIISNSLEPYVVQFVEDANAHGIDGLDIVFSVDEILEMKLDSISSNLRGVYVYSENYAGIWINTSIMFDSLATKHTLYHELMHVVNKKHDTTNKNRIMFPYHTLKEIDSIYTDSTWKAELNILFNNIK